MGLFSRRQPTPPPPDDDDRAIGELMDRHHHRASILDGNDRMIIDPGQVLENFALTMERLDNDIDTVLENFALTMERLDNGIDTPVGVSDAASFEEVLGMVQTGMGSFLAVHLLNTAMRIMSARYPEELVRLPLPEQYDLRKLVPVLTFTDEQHETARQIFNQRTRSATDLQAEDLDETWSHLNEGDQVQIITALFFMYGNKIGAMKYRTGIR
ncbi:hypothetical protein QTQ03_05820 [Micromonospora sp. WMMA1363]|uniref:hypothetical protein n=1 Tax=Micromonospora sp. WMMA1363 TaxID=3053985 RepID=UPI00259CFD3B|nr:hypothetical protein [Micromonospora sp. WMMA1363]MDM4719137.1 hypothetical protein [Micromonospora sp. WMMA1363]